MTNELIFCLQALLVGLSALTSLHFGRSALVGFISMQCVLANLFVTKQITLFGFTATCSDAFSIGAVLGLNLLQEYYGQVVAQRAIWINFLLLTFYTAMSCIHLMYLPHPADTAHTHFYEILNVMPRIAAASFFVYILVQYLDSIIYANLRELMTGKYLLLRTWLSIATVQLVDTILFSFLGLYGIVDDVVHIIAISYAIKLLAVFLATPCVAFSQWLYQSEPAGKPEPITRN